jgi:hypothetical protein
VRAPHDNGDHDDEDGRSKRQADIEEQGAAHLESFSTTGARRLGARRRPREAMLAQYKPTEAEPPREPRSPKTAPRLRDGSLMLFTPALIRAPVHASRLVRKFEADRAPPDRA